MRPTAMGQTVAIVLLALVAHSWVLWLDFGLADFLQIPRVEDKLANEVAVITSERTRGPFGQHLFRPALWSLLSIEKGIQSRPLAAMPFHLVSLLIHAACCGLLFRLARRRIGNSGAFLAGAFCAVHPGGSQAIHWISARGDLMVATLAATAAIMASRHRLHGRKSTLALGALALALAPASKVTGFMVAPIVILFLLGRNRGPGWFIVRAACLVLPWSLVIVWRQHYMGTWQISYPFPMVNLADVPRALVTSLPRVVEVLVVPWNLETTHEDTWPVFAHAAFRVTDSPRTLVALLILAVPVAGLLTAPLEFIRKVWPFFLGLVFLSFPLLFVHIPKHGNPIHAFYPLMLPLAGILGTSFDVMGSSARSRAIRLALFLILAIVTADAGIHAARTNLRYDHRVVDQLESLQEVARTAPGADVVIVGYPITGSQTIDASRPPFRRSVVPVHIEFDVRGLVSSRILRKIDAPVRLAYLFDDLIEATGPVIPAKPDPLPAFLPNGEGEFVPEFAVPPRAIGAISVRFARPTAEGAALVIKTPTREYFLPIPVGSERAILLPPQRIGWLLASEVRSIRVLGGDIRVLSISGEAPLVRIVRPADRARFPRDGAEFVDGFVFDPAGASRFRLEIRVPSPNSNQDRYIAYEFDRTATRDLDDGVIAYKPEDRHTVESVPRNFTFSQLMHLWIAAEKFGLRSAHVLWKVTAMNEAGLPIAESRPRRFILLR